MVINKSSKKGIFELLCSCHVTVLNAKLIFILQREKYSNGSGEKDKVGVTYYAVSNITTNLNIEAHYFYICHKIQLNCCMSSFVKEDGITGEIHTVGVEIHT